MIKDSERSHLENILSLYSMLLDDSLTVNVVVYKDETTFIQC